MRCFCVVALLCLIAGCGGAPDKASDEADSGAARGSGVAKEGGSSPEDVFNKIKGGFESGDYASVLKYMAPDDQNSLLYVTMMGLGIATMGDKVAATEVEGILKKHGMKADKENNVNLSDEVAAKKALAETFKDVKDKPALFEELMKALEKHAGKTNPPIPENAQLTNVKIEGDTATGTITSEGKEKEVNFVKIDGRWYAGLD